MKKIYEQIEVELIYLTEDIVTTSKDDLGSDIFEPLN